MLELQLPILALESGRIPKDDVVVSVAEADDTEKKFDPMMLPWVESSR